MSRAIWYFITYVLSTGQNDLMVRVRFLEDKIIYTCPKLDVLKRISDDHFLVLWKDKKSYEGEILEG